MNTRARGARRKIAHGTTAATRVERGAKPVHLSPVKPILPLTLGLAVVTIASTHGAPNAPLLFGENCASCHGADGKARTPAGRKLGARDLSQSTLADADIVKQIRNGTRNERGAERMPGFKEKLSADEIDALVTYVKSFRPRR